MRFNVNALDGLCDEHAFNTFNTVEADDTQFGMLQQRDGFSYSSIRPHMLPAQCFRGMFA
jgi:hypothetical protein